MHNSAWAAHEANAWRPLRCTYYAFPVPDAHLISRLDIAALVFEF